MAATRTLGSSSSCTVLLHNPRPFPFPFPCNINLSLKTSFWNSIPTSRHKHLLMAGGSGRHKNSKVEIICQKRTHGRFQNDRNSPRADGGKGDNSWSELTTYKSISKNVSNDLKNEQVIDAEDLKGVPFLNAVVKITG